ncbi:hypothetical protein D915_001713 [Fasciola hepatica]|uniref:LIM zinc-binding domain-containing protein n=1 Tax=Fasciola hepatica TaxID=6192 RepID=A0A4E0RWS5_FASHE|nr:hypothetical protein D915_001713 [Fasciola hepatica]
MNATKNYRVVAEVHIDGGASYDASDFKEMTVLAYDEQGSPEASFVNNPQSRTPSPMQIVQAVPATQLRCFGCGHTIEDTTYLTVLNGIFHDNCFRCDACKTLLEVTRFQVVDGKPHCDPPCPEQLNSLILVAATPFQKESTVSDTMATDQQDVLYQTVIVEQEPQRQESQREYCSACGLIIATNLFVRALDGIFHNECFRCDICHRLLRVGSCKFVDSKLRCDPDCVRISRDSPSFTERPASAGPLGERTEKTLPMSRYHFTMESKRERTPRPSQMDLVDKVVIDTMERQPKVDFARTPPQYTCFLCHLPISLADRLDRLNRTYHRNCFRCHKCHRLLQEHKYNIQEENPCCQPYCGYEEKSVQPTYLNTTAEDIRISTVYHRPFEKTVSSGRVSRGQQTRYEDVYPLHRSSSSTGNVWKTKSRSLSQPEAVHCFDCNKNVYAAERINAMNRVYHRTCFRCYVCKNVLNVGRFGVYDGKPLCEPHQKQLQNMRSLSSQSLRSDYADQDFGRLFQEARIEMKMPPTIPAAQSVQEHDHISMPSTQYEFQHRIPKPEARRNVEHAFDNPKRTPVQLMVAKGAMGETKSTLYNSMDSGTNHSIDVAQTPGNYTSIHADDGHHKLKFHNRSDYTVSDNFCFACGKKVYVAERLLMLDRLYHRNCFRCAACNNVLNVGRYSVHDDQPYCIPHHKQLLYLSNSSLRGLKGGLSLDELNTEYAETTTPMEVMTKRMATSMKANPETRAAIPFYHSNTISGTGNSYVPETSAGALQQKIEPVQAPAVRGYQNPLAVLTKSLREQEADHRFCARCLLEIGLDDRILLTDRAVHARCAECHVCHLNLNSLNCKELNGQLFCDVHYSQEVALLKQPRRNSSVSAKGIQRSQSTPESRKTINIDSPQTKAPKSGMPVFGTLVSSSTIDTLRQIVPNGAAQNALQKVRPDTPMIHQGQSLQAQHEELTEKLNVLDGDAGSKPMLCVTCNQSVQPSMFLQLEGKKYHFGCIRCQVCGKRLNRWSYKEISGEIYCSKHFHLISTTNDRTNHHSAPSSRSSTPRKMIMEKLYCFACDDCVYQPEILNVLDRVYHRNCFKCVVCHNTLSVENYYVHEGAPYCKSHYMRVLHSTPANIGFIINETVPAEQEQNPCFECQLPVHPRDGMNVIDRFYHYGCFKCTECQEVLNMGKFEVANGQPFCEMDYIKIFGRNPHIPTRVPPHRFAEVMAQE